MQENLDKIICESKNVFARRFSKALWNEQSCFETLKIPFLPPLIYMAVTLYLGLVLLQLDSLSVMSTWSV